MKDNRKELDIIGNLKYFFLFVIFLIGILFLLNILAEKRKLEITKTYYDEAQKYIVNNQEGLEIIFNDGFSTKSADLKIDFLISADLKDFSSTFFVKETALGKIEYLRLSKERGDLSIFPPENQTKILELLHGQIQVLPWDKYTYFLNSKEVLIPVKNRQGQIMGALVRGVVE